MSADPPEPVTKLVDAAQRRLGDRLVAIYAFGSGFARGLKAADARLLVLVDRIDDGVLEDARSLATDARASKLALRLDTADDILRGADVFPVFVLELLDTKELLAGADVLSELTVHTGHLRLRVEQILRVLHRDLLLAYVDARDDRGLAVALRRAVRRAVYLLRALALVCDVELASPPSAEATIEAVLAKVRPGTDPGVWQRMRRFAAFEDALEHPALVTLYCESLAAFSELVGAVDELPA